MNIVLTVIQIVVAVSLVVVVILQQRGDHKGGAFGTSGASYRSKKGVEQFLFYSTIFLAAIFASLSILAVVI